MPNMSNLIHSLDHTNLNIIDLNHSKSQQQLHPPPSPHHQHLHHQIVSNSKDFNISVSSNNFNDGNSEFPNLDINCDFDLTSASNLSSPILSSEVPSNVVDPIGSGQGGGGSGGGGVTAVTEEAINEKWHFDCNTSMIFKPPSEDGRNEGSNMSTSSITSKMSLSLNGGFDMKWVYQCGYFKSKNMGSISWNGKHWCWSHPRTSYKIKYIWDPTKQSFLNIPFKSRVGATGGGSVPSSQSTNNLQSSTSSMSSLSSSSTSTTKRSHPTTLYPDYQFKDNLLTPIIIEGRHQPSLTLIDSPLTIPNACLLTIAMTQYIQDALIHLSLGPKVLSSK